jgi:TolA-binding protein
LAELKYSESDWEKAAEYFAKAAAAGPKNFKQDLRISLMQRHCLLALNREEDAKALLEDLFARHPGVKNCLESNRMNKLGQNRMYLRFIKAGESTF